eukprot:scaffold15.g4352.t1
MFTQDQLAQTRRMNLEASAVAAHKAKAGNKQAQEAPEDEAPGPALPPPPISPEEELLLLKYYQAKLQHMCRELRLPRKVLGTAVTYMKRVYLSYSSLDQDPQQMVLACLYLACKTEEHYISAAELGRLTGVPADVMLRNELAALQALKFDLIVHSPYKAVDGFLEDIRAAVASPAEPSSLDEGLAGLAEEQLAKAKASAYAAADALMLSDAPLLRPPGQLALAALRSAFHEARAAKGGPAVAAACSWLGVKLKRYLLRAAQQAAAAGGGGGGGNGEAAVRVLEAALAELDALGAAGAKGVSQEEAAEIDRKLKVCRNPALLAADRQRKAAAKSEKAAAKAARRAAERAAREAESCASGASASASPARMQLQDLDNGCLMALLRVCEPRTRLQFAKTSRRFRDLACSDHLALVVSASAGEAGEGGERSSGAGASGGRRRFRTLAAAVAASKAGDTILLEPGPTPHRVEGCVVVPHALHILGGGGEPGATVLVGAAPAEAVIEFRASGQLCNLSIRGDGCACVQHAGGGSLTVLGCALHCDTRGLGQLGLVSPLVTCAAASGRLSVQSTRICGDRGARAVHQRGAGALRSVRVLPGAQVFWLEADCAGVPVAAARGGRKRGAPDGGEQLAPAGAGAPPGAAPAWMTTLDARGFEARLAGLAGGAAAGDAGGGGGSGEALPTDEAGEQALAKRACRWQALSHSAASCEQPGGSV